MTVDSEAPLRTGIDILDRKLGGGIPPGTVTALVANPGSQAELFLYEFATAGRTLYLSTIRTADAVASVFESQGRPAETVEPVDIRGTEPVDQAQSILADLGDGSNLVIDPVDVLEADDTDRYREFLAELKDRTTGTDSVAFLHCLRDDATPAGRRKTIHVADLVFELSTEVRGDSVVNRLTVPKFRNGQSIEDVIKLDLTSEIEVDLSRNIL